MVPLVVGTFLTLDGVMQGPGGPDEDRSGGFASGGWSVGYWDDAMGKIITEWTAKADALLLGRTTYEIFAAHWPHVSEDDPVGAVLNRVPKYVASTTLKTVSWNNATLLEGDVPGAVAALKDARSGEIQVHGSCGLLQTLIEHDLIDEYRLWTFPVLLGVGKRLFDAGTIPAGLELMTARPLPPASSSTATVAQATSDTARSQWTSEEGSRRSGRRGNSADRDHGRAPIGDPEVRGLARSITGLERAANAEWRVL